MIHIKDTLGRPICGLPWCDTEVSCQVLMWTEHSLATFSIRALIYIKLRWAGQGSRQWGLIHALTYWNETISSNCSLISKPFINKYNILCVLLFLEAWPSNIFYFFPVYTYRKLHKDTNQLAVSQVHTLKKMLKTVP